MTPPKSDSSLNDFYEKRYAGDYMDTDSYTVWGHEDLRTQEIIETLSHVPGKPAEILDYGCGVGGWFGVLKRVYPGSTIYGVDVSSNAIEKAATRYPNGRF